MRDKFVISGRVFCRRLVDVTCHIKQPQHKIRITSGIKTDIEVYLKFLEDFNGVSVMLDQYWL